MAEAGGSATLRVNGTGSRAVPWFEGAHTLVDVTVAAGFAESKRAAQRLIAEGAVKIDGSVVTDPKIVWDTSRPAVLQVGSRKFVRVLSEKG